MVLSDKPVDITQTKAESAPKDAMSPKKLDPLFQGLPEESDNIVDPRGHDISNLRNHTNSPPATPSVISKAMDTSESQAVLQKHLPVEEKNEDQIEKRRDNAVLNSEPKMTSHHSIHGVKWVKERTKLKTGTQLERSDQEEEEREEAGRKNDSNDNMEEVYDQE